MASRKLCYERISVRRDGRRATSSSPVVHACWRVPNRGPSYDAPSGIDANADLHPRSTRVSGDPDHDLERRGQWEQAVRRPKRAWLSNVAFLSIPHQEKTTPTLVMFRDGHISRV